MKFQILILQTPTECTKKKHTHPQILIPQSTKIHFTEFHFSQSAMKHTPLHTNDNRLTAHHQFWNNETPSIDKLLFSMIKYFFSCGCVNVWMNCLVLQCSLQNCGQWPPVPKSFLFHLFWNWVNNRKIEHLLLINFIIFPAVDVLDLYHHLWFFSVLNCRFLLKPKLFYLTTYYKFGC